MRNIVPILFVIACIVGCTTPKTNGLDLQNQVMATEKLFAKSMADRDIGAFSTYISEEAVFFSGADALRGRGKIIEQWAPFFIGKSAPFSWFPDHVEVLESGTLALSTGPVYAPDGRLIARFSSIWRLESSGRWKIIFDKGCDVCVKCIGSAPQ